MPKYTETKAKHLKIKTMRDQIIYLYFNYKIPTSTSRQQINTRSEQMRTTKARSERAKVNIKIY